MKRTQKEIRRELEAHLYSVGTINDSTTERLYREAHDIPNDQDTDLETVENWAVYGD